MIAVPTISRIFQGIPNPLYRGSPAQDPLDRRLSELRTPHVALTAMTSNGGPNSRYILNEDSFFMGMDASGSVFAGVLDGTNGIGPQAKTLQGHAASGMANNVMTEALGKGERLSTAFSKAHLTLLNDDSLGLATAAVAVIDPSRAGLIGATGDARGVLLRGGFMMHDRSPTVQSWVANEIRQGRLKPHEIHTHPRLSSVYGFLGSTYGDRHEERIFSGESGDQLLLASDGIWNVVTDYEVERLARKLKGKDLLIAVFDLAFERNNSDSPFEVSFSDQMPLTLTVPKNGGDNLTMVSVSFF